jgi:hypothetical protein
MCRRIASNRVEAQKKAARGRARTPKVRQLAPRKDTLRLQFFWLTENDDVTNYGSQMRFGIRWRKRSLLRNAISITCCPRCRRPSMT